MWICTLNPFPNNKLADLPTPDFNFQEHLSWKLGTPENFQEQQCCGGCRVTLIEQRCQQLCIRLSYEFKYTHFQKYNNNNTEKGLVGKIGASLPRRYKIKGIIPEKAPPLCHKNPWKSKSCVKRIAISYAVLIDRGSLDNEYIWLASFSVIDQTHLRCASKTLPWFQRFYTCSWWIVRWNFNSSFLRPISAKNLSINTRYVVCCSGWQNMPETSEFLSLWRNLNSRNGMRENILTRTRFNFMEKSYQFWFSCNGRQLWIRCFADNNFELIHIA